MIRYLEGTIRSVDVNSVIVVAGGVGYEVFLLPRELRAVQVESGAVAGGASGPVREFFTYQHVREAELSLYGFAAREELDLFEACLSVSGIGPKAALKIVDLGSVDEIKEAILQENLTFLTRVSGLGKKKAQRLVTEAKGKIEELGVPMKASGGAAGRSVSLGGGDRSLTDALGALVGLGYKEYEVVEVLRALPATAVTAEQKVREALRLLGLGQGQRV